jgi:hypothetical protein
MIPTQHVYKINPNTADPDRLRVIYTFSEEDQIRSMYRFPHCPGTFWTHFRFFQDKTYPPIEMELIVITEEDTTHSILKSSITHDWNDLKWPFPSFDGTHSGLYLKVHGIEIGQISISLLGWINLFPMAPTYRLYGEDHICQFAIVQENTESYEKNIKRKGAIHNALEPYSPVRNQPMVAIRPLSHYH